MSHWTVFDLRDYLAQGGDPGEAADEHENNCGVFDFFAADGGHWIVKTRRAEENGIIPCFLPPIYPPEQLVTDRWVIQCYYPPVGTEADPELFTRIRLTHERIGIYDLHPWNVGRDSAGRLVAFDWYYDRHHPANLEAA